MNDNKLIIISESNFSIAKSKKFLENAFANINDSKERTAIIETEKLNEKDFISKEDNYKLITFDMVLPFSMVGFIAKIAQKLAEEKIPISAYSTDHLFVKQEFLSDAVSCLNKLRFEVK